MMVIKVRTGGTAVHNVQPNSTGIYPADRCSWMQVPETRGYSIDRVFFYTGNAAAVQLDPDGIVSIELGFIGKSGRFVAITNAST